MPRRAWIAALSFWPGLPQIWSGQEVLGLLLAAFFATTFNLAVICNFIWTDWFSPGWSGFFTALALCSWLAGLGYTVWWVWRCHPAGHRPELDSLYREAIDCYLRGNFRDSRRQLERVLELDEGDADALMQLGTLFVRTEQPALARRAFRNCMELENGRKWRWEIQQTLARLDHRESPQA